MPFFWINLEFWIFGHKKLFYLFIYLYFLRGEVKFVESYIEWQKKEKKQNKGVIPWNVHEKLDFGTLNVKKFL